MDLLIKAFFLFLFIKGIAEYISDSYYWPGKRPD